MSRMSDDLAEPLLRGPMCSAAVAEERVPACPGYYAIFVNDGAKLPSPFCDVLARQGTLLIYIGIATVSLKTRLVDQDLRHKSPSTFFRGIGAVLGYRPPHGSLVGKKNQKNYKFSKEDTVKIVEWLNAHAAIAWAEAAPALKAEEEAIIRAQRPPLNTKHNPDALPELAALRALCRDIARGA